MPEPTEEDYIVELLERLRDCDEREQRHAVRALARLGRRAVPALLEALAGEDWALRKHAASVFALAPDARALPLLCQALRDLDWEVRREAAGALKVMAPPEAAPLLLSLLQEEAGHPQVRLIAIEALLAIREADTGVRVSNQVWEDAIPSLCEALAGPEWRLHGAAAELLGVLRAEPAVDALWSALGTADLEEALRITTALGQIGSARAVEPLRVALSHRDGAVRAAAAGALGRMGGDDALMLLAGALRSRDPFRRRGAAKGLERVAKSTPTRSLRVVVAPLRRLLSPLAWTVSKEDRALFSRVLQQVETATTSVRDLPLPSGHEAGSAQLPLPADATASGPDGDCMVLGLPGSAPPSESGWHHSVRRWWDHYSISRLD